MLRINDTGTGSGDKVKWLYSWEATNTRGATVLVRARCASYTPGAPTDFPINIMIHDGKYIEEIAILSDQIRSLRTTRQYPLDGTEWHTYRVTTQGDQFSVYVDEDPLPVIQAPLTITRYQDPGAKRAMILFGSGSSASMQDIYFDYVHCYSNGAFEPMVPTSDQTPDVSVKVWDIAGKGSMSGIAPSTAKVHWSTDGGATWLSSGGTGWQCRYEGGVLPSAAVPGWTVVEGSEVWASVDSGILRVNDTGTVSGDKIKWSRNWGASPATGTTVITRARCASHGPDTTYTGNIMVEDGSRKESLKILTDRIETGESGQTYFLDGTAWHVYRMTTEGTEFKVYVDEDPTPVLQGTMGTTTSTNRVMFGSGSSTGTQDIYFDYVRYTSNGALLPGEGGGSGTLWTCLYEGDVVPSGAVPEWTVAEGSEVWASVDSGILRVNDTGTVSGDKIKWSRNWGASPPTGTTVITRARCASHGPDTTYTGNLFVEDGSHREFLKILTDRVVAAESGDTYMLDGTAWHIYRMTTEGTQFKLYVDEDPTPVLQGTMTATSTYNRVMFGSGSSSGTQDIYFDYVRYTADGVLLPGEGDGTGLTTITCTGQYGTDRSTIVAYGVPFDQYSRTLNKVRFSVSDTLGNVGWSPVYNVSILDYATSISDVKSAPDGTIVSLADKVLYLKETDFAYIEEPDRTSGIRLEGTVSANQDQLVNVSGSMQTTTWGERYIAVSNVQGIGPGEVAPLGVTNVGLAETMLDGCYVTAWGTVMEGSIWEGFFYITDGADEYGIKVTTEGMPTVDEGDFVVVIGAAGLEDYRVVHARDIIQ